MKKFVCACGCIWICGSVDSMNREIEALAKRLPSKGIGVRTESLKRLRSLLEFEREPNDMIKNLAERLPSEGARARAESLKKLRTLLEFERDEPVAFANSKVKTLAERVSTEDVRARTESLKKLRPLLESQRKGELFQGFYVGLGLSRKSTKDEVYCPISEAAPKPVVVAPAAALAPAPVVVPAAGVIAVAAGAADGGVLADNVAIGAVDPVRVAAANLAAGAVDPGFNAADMAVGLLGPNPGFLAEAAERAAAIVDAGANLDVAAIYAVAVVIADAARRGAPLTANDIARASAAAALAAANTRIGAGDPIAAANNAFNAVVAVNAVP